MSNRSPNESTLHVVATPIGTLADLSPRALAILRDVDFIACEDTRHTGKLLSAYGVKTPLVSLHQHNERERSASVVERIYSGARGEAALVTDAGTPGVSDPGAWLVAAAHEKGVRVLSAPGPSSLAAALGACGFEARRAVFSTFFPRERKERETELRVWWAAAPCVGVCFESPQRLVSTLAFFAEKLPPGALVCVSREISKKHEEHVRGNPADVLAAFEARDEVRGECVVCVELNDATVQAQSEALREAAEAQGEGSQVVTVEQVARACLDEVARTGALLKRVAKAKAELSGFSAKDIYAAAQSLRDTAHGDGES